MVDLTLRPGNRGFITGTSGSGKTTLALALCEAMPAPLVVLDTKYDPGIAAWAKRHKIRIWNKRDMPDWRKIREDIVVRPRSDWLAHPEDIDWWLGQAFYCPYVPSIYIDEGYQVGATSSRIGEGVSGLWTRGRVFGIVSLIGTQRPAWINKFVITESDHLYIGCLRLEDDRKKIAQATGQTEALDRLAKRHFMYINQDEDRLSFLKPLDMNRPSAYLPKERHLTMRKMQRIR